MATGLRVESCRPWYTVEKEPSPSGFNTVNCPSSELPINIFTVRQPKTTGRRKIKIRENSAKRNEVMLCQGAYINLLTYINSLVLGASALLCQQEHMRLLRHSSITRYCGERIFSQQTGPVCLTIAQCPSLILLTCVLVVSGLYIFASRGRKWLLYLD